MNITRGRQLVQLVISSSHHLRQQRLNEVTGQLDEDEQQHLQQCDSDTSSEVVLFGEGSSSDSDYLPEESNLSVGFLPNALEESKSSNDEVLDQESGVLTRRNSHNRKRCRKGQADQSKWKRIKNSNARLQGKQYEGFEKGVNGKYKQTLLRPAKNLQERCDGHTEVKHGGPKQRFECEMLTEVERKMIFDSYWALCSWEARKVYVRSLVSVNAPQYRRSSSVDSRKAKAFKYFLSLRDNAKRVHVCKQMFMKTLCIGQRQLRDWVVSLPNKVAPASSDISQNGIDCNVRIQTNASDSIREFFDSLPKVESHYCRSSSSKLYLEPIWNSVHGDLYAEYKKFCCDNNKKRYCVATFERKYRELNLSIFKPRKDQCNKCLAYKNGNIDEDEYRNHLNKKETARQSKDYDKNNTEDDVLVYTMDVQAVLLCPRIQASAVYYKTKLKVHNYTHYNLKTKEVICYLWHEGNGGLDSDVFTSIMMKHLKAELEKAPNTKKIILWSDGCGYQNRSLNLSNALIELSVEKNIIVEQKYLEVGHTQMEVDSIHSSIERKLPPHRDIFIPGDYINIIKSARSKPEPYKVVFLSYSDFSRCEGGRYSSIRPGNKKGDPLVVDIVSLQYKPDGIIRYKLDFKDDYKELPRRSKKNNTRSDNTALYQSHLPIDTTKFIHLQELKSLIPKDYHPFYDSLEHNCSGPDACPHIRNI